MSPRTLMVFALTGLAACADAPVLDLDPFEEPSLEAAKADRQDYDNWTFIEKEADDFRRCMYPLCGGMYVSRTNQSKIKCPGTGWDKQCYVAQYDFSAIAEGEEAERLQQEARADRLVVRGELKTGFFPDFPEVAVLAVTEAWIAATEVAPSGILYRATDLGITCVTAPCLSIELTRLNRNAAPLSRVAGADFTRVAANDDQLQGIWQAMRDDAVLVAGRLKSVTGPGGKAHSLDAAQVFSRFESQGVIGRACGARAPGCPDGYVCQFQDALCGAADGQGKCELKPEACTEQYEPVCGCDGITYGNDCFRLQMGAGFGTPGECKVARGCQIGGCGGTLCANAGDEMPMTICVVRPSDECYQKLGVCEPQGLACGWTATPELESCLAGAAGGVDQSF